MADDLDRHITGENGPAETQREGVDTPAALGFDPVARTLSELNTPRQLRDFRDLCRVNGTDPDAVSLARYNARPEELTKVAIEALIRETLREIARKAGL